MEPEDYKEKKGSVLVLSVVITMVVLATAIVLGTVIISSLKRAQLQSSSYYSYYAAESMMEKALYLLRKEKRTPAEIEAEVNDCGDFPGLASAVDNCATDVEYDTSVVFSTIPQNTSVQMKLIDFEGGGTNAGVQRLVISCVDASWLEVTETVIADASGWGVDVDVDEPEKTLFSCAASGNPSITLDMNKSYDITIKALYDDANSVSVYAFDSAVGGNLVPLGNYFTVTTGANHSIFSRQTISVRVPGVSTISNLFDYVVYSERVIVKDIQVESSP